MRPVVRITNSGSEPASLKAVAKIRIGSYE